MKTIAKVVAFSFVAFVFSFSCTNEEPAELILSTSKITFSKDGGVQTIFFSTNKNWIATSSASWLTIPNSGNSGSISINVTAAPNAEFDERNAVISIKVENIEETIAVNQAQEDGLFITKTDYSITNEEQNLTIEIQANVEYEVFSEVDWIQYVGAKALQPSNISLHVLRNDTYDNRTGKVYVKQVNGNLLGAIVVSQDESHGLFVSPETFELTNEEQTISANLQTNIEYKTIIPEDVNWISVVPPVKGLSSEVMNFHVNHNSSFESRETDILFQHINGEQSNKVHIVQAPTDTIYFTSQIDSISYEGGDVPVCIVTNFEYSITSETDSGITIGEGQYIGTKSGLSYYSHNLSVPYNTMIEPKLIRLFARSKDGKQECLYQIWQCPQPSITFEDKYAELVCLRKYDTNGDGILTYFEASQVKSISGKFFGSYQAGVTTFDEFKYFTNVKSVASEAFMNCTNLVKITLPEHIFEIGAYAFDWCPKLRSINLPDGLKYIRRCGIFSTAIEVLELPESLISIDNSGIAGNNITSIYLPENIETLGNAFLRECPNLKYISGKFASDDNRAVVQNGKLLAFAPYGLSEYTTPSTTKIVATGTFNGCNNLKKLFFNEGITDIQIAIFEWCKSFPEVLVFPSSTLVIGSVGDKNTVLYCKAMEPPILNTSVKGQKVYVPYEAIDAYKSSEKWGQGIIAGFDVNNTNF